MKTLSGKRILITGGAGFIGSALCEHFLAQDNEVVCLDNLITGKWENIEPFQSNKNFKFIEGDIRDSGTCLKACDGIDYAFHQAALGSVPRSIENPQRTNEINITGTLNMFWAAKESRVKRLVFASSSSVYGDSPTLPKVEEAIGEPLSPYAVTKLVNEKYAKVFNDVYGLETIGLRYFNVFGRRQDPDGAYAAVIPKWVKMLIRHESPVINGDGSYSRDFTYIDNVVMANELAAVVDSGQLTVGSGSAYAEASADESRSTGAEEQRSSEAQKLRSSEEKETAAGTRQPATSNQQPVGKVYNVAFGGNTTLNELFALLRDNLAEYDLEIKDIEPVYGPLRAGDIPHSHASIDKARELLGYNPQYDARKGFEIACEWYWRNLRP